MPTTSRSIPVLPSRSLPATLAFYEALGFRGRVLAAGRYAILERDELELHFFPHPALEPAECYAGCYLRTPAVDALRREFESVGMPATGIPRLEPVADQPWAMREFALVDADGNLVKFGWPL